MEKFVLYQISGSHFCDKVRWALDTKQLPYECVIFNTDGTTSGLERAPTSLVKLTPIIEDPNNKDENGSYFISDSTPILLYLDEHYPSPFLLFPLNIRQSIIDFCLHLDSTLGPYARRLIYVQIIGECPQILCLSQRAKYPWASNPDDMRSSLVARVVASFLIARFRLHRIREDEVVEKTEQVLLDFKERLNNNSYVIGNQFTAADMTFCALVLPLQIIPRFRDDSRFKNLFEYHDRIRKEHDFKFQDNVNQFGKFIDIYRHRQANPTCFMKFRRFLSRINIIKSCLFWFLGLFVQRFYGPSTDDEESPQFNRSDRSAANDQRTVNLTSKLGAVRFFIKYTLHRVFTMPGQFACFNDS